MTIDLSSLLTTVSAMVIAWLSYHQYTKNKMTDFRIEELKSKAESQKVSRNTQSTLVYGQLWHLLHALNCSRAFIIQPHPLDKQLYISLTYEVLRSGAVSLRESIVDEPMGGYALFCKTLAAEDFIFAADIDDLKEEADKRFLALLANAGGAATAVKRLTDDRHDWTGSLFCIWHVGVKAEDKAIIQKELEEAALAIQYVLPEVA